MKINVQVDLSEFYSDESEATFSEQIKEEIARNVRRQVYDSFKEKIGEEFNRAVIAEVEKQKEKLITDKLNELVVDAKLKKHYSSGEMISISQWLVVELERMQLNESKLRDYLNKQVETSSKQISEELKKRYDMVFASQIVSKLNDNSMLSPLASKMLLDE